MKKKNLDLRSENRINAVLSEYLECQCNVVGWEAAKGFLLAQYPEIRKEGVFHCILSFNGFLNAYRTANDFPEAFATYLTEYSASQIVSLKGQLERERDKRKEIFLEDIEKYAS